jgi:hypothetical protein
MKNRMPGHFASLSSPIAVLAAILLLFPGCKPSNEAPNVADNARQAASPAATSASISASPNPVPAGNGNGTTTIKWTTGDGSMGQIYVTSEPGEETLFAGAPEGSTDAPWIQSDKTYEFRLYAGSEHRKVLATIAVTRQK